MSELDAAIIQWRKVAASERQRVELRLTHGCDDVALRNAALYDDVAKALEIQRDTGEAVCCHCFKPTSKTKDARGYHSCVG